MSVFTPENITTLAQNQIFVFGSNPMGFHDKGAAKLARGRFGAVQGRAVGMQGQSYAIPTQGSDFRTPLPIAVVQSHVNDFIAYAKAHPELEFLVTKIGCGLARRSPAQIAPLFRPARGVENIILPRDFAMLLRHNS